MLINLRNALMGGKRLPYDAEVEYLESSGTQYIDTGFKANTTTTRLDIELMLTQSTTNMGLFGSRNATGTSSSSSCNAFFLSANQVFRMDWASGGGPLFNCLPNTAYSISITRGSVTINGSTTTYTNTDSVDQENNFLIFSFAEGSGVVYQNGMIGRVFGAKIYSNGILVRDYIPVRRGAVGYLYDRVSGKLFGNAGTGDFVLGQDVVPVEYIESHGTQYIDTGVVATNSHGFRVDIATSQKSGDVNTRIFGVHEGNVRCGFALYGTTEPSGNDFFWGWNAATGFIADIPQRFVASLNYKNDRAAIFDGTTNLSSLGTLGNTTKSIYLLNANYNGAPFENQYVVGKLYGAEITVGSDVANHYLPVRVGTEGAMMDVLTRRIYRNAGTGAFGYGNDLKYPIPAE